MNNLLWVSVVIAASAVMVLGSQSLDDRREAQMERDAAHMARR